MPHWPSRTRTQASSDPARATEPAALSPVEWIPEILEALFIRELDLTKALLAELGRAGTATSAKLSAQVRPGL